MTIKSLDSIQFKPLFETAQRRTLTDKEYFGTALKGYVSNSQLSLINPDQEGSPEKFLNGFKGQAKSSSLDIGSAVHAILLEPTKYKINTTIDKPTGKVGPIIEHLYSIHNPNDMRECLKISCKEHDYYTNSLTDNRIDTLWEKGKDYFDYLIQRDYLDESDVEEIILTKDEREKSLGAIGAVKAHSLAMKTLFPNNDILDIHTYTEDVITMDVELTVGKDVVPISLKGKVDNFSVDFDSKQLIINDLKTTGKPVENFMGYNYHDTSYENGIFVDGSFQRFHYNRQMAMYGWMLWNYSKLHYEVDKSWNANVNMVVVESQAPHGVKVYKINKEWISKGYQEFLSLIKRVAWHKVNGFDKTL
jgi:hypothetical protein